MQMDIQQISTPLCGKKKKQLTQGGLGGNFSHLIKGPEGSLTATVILNGKRVNAFSLRPGTRPGHPFLPLSLNIVLKVPATAVGQADEVEDTQIGKGGQEPCLH